MVRANSLLLLEMNRIHFLFKFENASNMIVTIVYLVLEDFVKDHGRLPRKLHLNLGRFKKGNLTSGVGPCLDQISSLFFFFSWKIKCFTEPNLFRNKL